MPVIHDVPLTFWAQVATEEQAFHPGERCVLLGGGQVAVVGIDLELGTLVRYSLPRVDDSTDADRDWRGEAGGTLCREGSLVFLPVEAVNKWPAEGEIGKANRALRERRANSVQRLLLEEDAGNGAQGLPSRHE